MNKIVQIILVLTVIGAFSGASLTYVYDWAHPKIVANQEKDRQVASKIVMPAASKFVEVKAKLPKAIATEFEQDEFIYYQALDSKGTCVGYVLETEGKGFQSTLRVTMGVTLDLSTITGVKINHFETPGFGDILGSAFFLDQLKNRTTLPDNQIGYIKKGSGVPKPNEIETKTGATVSQWAAGKTINKGLKMLSSVVEKPKAQDNCCNGKPCTAEEAEKQACKNNTKEGGANGN
jgi:RnfABCDGE-type electron transport complex G subunit